MRASLTLRLLLVLSPLVFGVAAALVLVMGQMRNRSIDNDILTRVQPSLEALEKGRLQVVAFAAQQQWEFGRRILALNGSPTSLAKPAGVVALRSFVKEIDPKVVDVATLGALRDGLNRMETAARSFAAWYDRIQDLKKDKDVLQKAVNDYNDNLEGLKVSQLRNIDLLQQQANQTLVQLRQQVQDNGQRVLVILGIGFVLELLLLVLYWLIIHRSWHLPLKHLLEKMKNRQQMTAEGHELGRVTVYINRLHTELKSTEAVLDQFSKGAYRDDFNDDNLPERVTSAFLTLRNRLRDLDEGLRSQEAELRRVSQQADARAQELRTAEKNLEALANLRRQLGVQLELDDQGKMRFANARLLSLTGFTAKELEGQSFAQALAADAALAQQALQKLSASGEWAGDLRLKTKDGSSLLVRATGQALQAVAGQPAGFVLLGAELTQLQKALTERERELSAAQQEAREARAAMTDAVNQLQHTRQQMEGQRALEYRLVQQQAALQELTRNDDLKAGNVREALRAVNETVVYALDLDRCGVWLFANNHERIRCIDMYERVGMSHTGGLELVSAEVPAFYGQVSEPAVVAIPNVASDARVADLHSLYLATHNIQSVLTAPLKLGGQVVGYLAVEHFSNHRDWSLDEQNFLLSIGEIVSLALEQGNRRAMEEELRMTLEESQALEEELRQNAEEIEATNEEMRRTQVELRGQINALNNAAIVSETNLQGRITYANTEFAHVYGYDPAEVRGKSHNLLKSGYHKDSFFADMWRSLNQGKVWRGELQNRTKQGDVRWVQATITPVLGLDGKPYKFISVAFDVTTQKSAEQEAREALKHAIEQENIVRNAAQALEATNEEMRRTQIELAGQISALNNSTMVYETNAKGHITYANPQLVQVTGYAESQLLGSMYTFLKAPHLEDTVFQEQSDFILRGEIWRGEMEFARADGRSIWVVLITTPVLDDSGELLKCIHVLLDITEQKEQEFRLKKQQTAILTLTQNPAIKEGDLEKGFEAIAEVGRTTLNVDRVSVWLFEDDDVHVRCLAVSQVGDHEHSKGTVIERSMYPNYFKTLERDRVIVSSTAQEDERIKELAFTLLKPRNITAVMDVAVRFGTRTIGLVSIEHQGPVRHWTLDEINFANSLADSMSLVLEQKQRQQTDKLRQAYQQLELASGEMIRQKEQLEETAATLTESIKYAKRIQQNILPDRVDMKAGLGNYFIVFRPKDIVGGDFYWFSRVDDERSVMIVADGTGHGVPGAFLTLIGYMMLNQIVNEKRIVVPSDILYHLHLGVRQALKQDEEESTSRDGMDVACSLINIKTLEVQYAGANLPLYLFQDWEVNELKPTKKSIGGEQLEEERVFENYDIQLKEGDALYMYTDGFVDQMGGPEGKRFSKRRFRDLVLRTQHESMTTQRALLNLEWKEWKDDREQLDDVTVFGVKF